jgi:hypothetical protein
MKRGERLALKGGPVGDSLEHRWPVNYGEVSDIACGRN